MADSTDDKSSKPQALQTTTVHLVTDAAVNPVGFELDGATPIRPLQAVLIRFAAPATDELAIPPADVAVALAPDAAKRLAQSLLAAARELEKGDR